MSTRCTLHFKSKGDKKPTAIIYRHSDGYPNTDSGVRADFKRFIEDVKKQCIGNYSRTRFNDPSYLAAKFVVWQANENVKDHNRLVEMWKKEKLTVATEKYSEPLDFLSLGVCMEDPIDIKYWYEVICSDDNKPPKLVCHEA